MAGILVSPSTDLRIRKRNALYKKRNEYPKFKDILRERCHSRIKAKRGALLEQFRHMGSQEEIHNALSSIVREEAKIVKEIDLETMDTEINMQEEQANIEDVEEENWFLREYERVLEEEESMLSEEWEKQVICPMCERSILKVINNQVVCTKCSSEFPPVPSLLVMQNALNSSVKLHEESCSDVSQFALINDLHMNGLYLICQTCGTFMQTL